MADNYRTRGSLDLTDTSDWSLGHVPAAGENIFFLEGADTYTAGQNMSANNVASVYIGPGRGDLLSKFGISGAPIRFEANSGGARPVRYCGNDGEVNLAGAVGGAGVIDIMEISPKNPSVRVTLSEYVATTRIVFDGAVGTVAASVVTSATTEIFVEGGDHIYDYASGNVPIIHVMAGRLRIRGDFTTLNVGNTGVAIIELNTAVAAGGAVNQTGGTIIHEQGALGAYKGYAGTLDQGGLKKNATYASAIGASQLRIITPKTGATVTYTAAFVDIGKGPTRS